MGLGVQGSGAGPLFAATAAERPMAARLVDVPAAKRLFVAFAAFAAFAVRAIHSRLQEWPTACKWRGSGPDSTFGG